MHKCDFQVSNHNKRWVKCELLFQTSVPGDSITRDCMNIMARILCVPYNYLHCIQEVVIRIQAQFHLPLCSFAQILEDEVLIDKGATLHTSNDRF